MRRFLPYLSALVILGIAGCGTPDEDSPQRALPEKSSREALSDTARPADPLLASRWEARRRLEIAYDELTSSLDSMWRDSSNVQAERRKEYRRILQDALTVKDNTKVFLENLLVSPQGGTPEIWEELRARTELSLDSLRRLVVSADSTHKLLPERPQGKDR